ncbi:MAG: zinc-ribbon domain-containing protein [Lachnospiraceae bacterium]|uniref:Zinc-ribbon domain-containing protein n=1 Tax=Candidatus Weimeria bifida TaxID=2599074 RepID=A0A6N7J2C2_9FIRM|nr:zinc-ribbon domain-containing protein [Candidatus Weimeria bifida]RRF96879.1 MAG: zinc-ribbon domain-containing protein [Lachnospiraceae bacterium]
MGFFDSLNEAGKGFGAAAKDAARTAKLNVRLRSLDDKLTQEFENLGKKYYEKHKNENTAENRRISEIYTEISDTKDELADIRGEVVCPNCGEYVPKNAKFCPNCGEDMNIFEESDTTDAETADYDDVFEDDEAQDDKADEASDDDKAEDDVKTSDKPEDSADSTEK